MIIKSGRYSICEDFPVLYQKIVGKTMLGEVSLRRIYQTAICAKHLPGLVAEMGVCRGGTLYLMASVLNNSIVYGFDSWEGLPKPQTEDEVVSELIKHSTPREGWGRVNIPSELFSDFGGRVKLIEGWFKDTLSVIEHERFRFVHIDCDRYQSVKECFEFFDSRMVPGGFINIHDYNYAGTPGAKTAVDEHLGKCKAQKLYTPAMFILQY